MATNKFRKSAVLHHESDVFISERGCHNCNTNDNLLVRSQMETSTEINAGGMNSG